MWFDILLLFRDNISALSIWYFVDSATLSIEAISLSILEFDNSIIIYL